MALKRLCFGISACLLVTTIAFGQAVNTRDTADLNGFLQFNSLGSAVGAGEASLSTLAEQSFPMFYPPTNDVELVGDKDGNIIGYYRVDGFGYIQYGVLDETTDLATSTDDFLNSGEVKVADPLNVILPASQMAGLPSAALPFFDYDIVRDLELATDWRKVTGGYAGIVLLDGNGGIHAIGDVNMPVYPVGGVETTTVYPHSLLKSGVASGQEETAVSGSPITAESPTASPLFAYFQFDIARDLEVTAQYTVVSDPIAGSARTVGMMNGYYILDGLGAVHSNRLPLNFDLNGDGIVTQLEVEDEDFGKPINNRPLVAPWQGEDVPYFGFDIARDLELTPSGNGFYLLDGFGAVHMVGDAHRSFPNSVTTWFGYDIARDLTLVPNLGEDTDGDGNPNLVSTGIMGYYVLDGNGNVHCAGAAQPFDIGDQAITSEFDVYRALEISPAYTPATEAVINAGYSVVNDANGDGYFDPFTEQSFVVGPDFVTE